MRYLAFLAAFLSIVSQGWAADAPKKVLLVTHAGGYMHDSILTAEQVLMELGPKNGFKLTCWRFTADPDKKLTVKRKINGKDTEVEMTALENYSARYEKMMGAPVAREQCGHINAQTLKNFDAVIFFTTSTWKADSGSHPLTEDELHDLIAWVNNGGAFVAVHCGSDTLHDTPYGDLVGGTFGGHPWLQKVRIHVEDPNHPAGKAFADGAEILDEIYQFGKVSDRPKVPPMTIQPYSREKLHIITSIDPTSIDLKIGARDDHDYASSWCHEVGKGKSFYTALGHHKAVWLDTRYQEHLLGGLKWAMGLLPGDATPSAKLKK